jgi:PKD repeat protein
MHTYTVEGTYQVSVVVTNTDGSQETLTTTLMITINKPIQITMFSAGRFNGNLKKSEADGRAGADALCLAAKPADLVASNVRAFISVNTDDEIRDMPANYGVPTTIPVVGPTDIQIADDWADLFDHSTDSLLSTLRAAGITPNTVENHWWSGANTQGALSDAARTCGQWTRDNTGVQSKGEAGSELSTGGSWLQTGSGISCNQFRELVCVAYDP